MWCHHGAKPHTDETILDYFLGKRTSENKQVKKQEERVRRNAPKETYPVIGTNKKD